MTTSGASSTGRSHRRIPVVVSRVRAGLVHVASAVVRRSLNAYRDVVVGGRCLTRIGRDSRVSDASSLQELALREAARIVAWPSARRRPVRLVGDVEQSGSGGQARQCGPDRGGCDRRRGMRRIGGVLIQRRARQSRQAGEAPRSPRVVSLASGTTRPYEYVFPNGAMYVYDVDHGFRLLQRVPLPGVRTVRGVVASPTTHMLYVAYGAYGGPGHHRTSACLQPPHRLGGLQAVLLAGDRQHGDQSSGQPDLHARR